MPSSPDSGPIMIWTLSCSTALRVELTALSGVASEDTLTNSIFLPPAMPFLSFSARSAPRMPSWPGAANGPSSEASRPTFKVSWACARPPIAISAAPARMLRPKILLPLLMSRSFFSSMNAATAAGGERGAQTMAQALPEAQQTVGGKQHDREEDPADHEIEALAVDQVDGEVLQQHEHDRADEGADRMLHAAEHGDDEDVDHRADTHGAGRDAAVVPDHQHPADRRQQARHRIGGDPVRRDVEAQRLHAARVVADALQRDAERRADEVLDEEVARQR